MCPEALHNIQYSTTLLNKHFKVQYVTMKVVMYLLLEDIVYSKTVLSELHCILLEVILMNSTNVL